MQAHCHVPELGGEPFLFLGRERKAGKARHMSHLRAIDRHDGLRYGLFADLNQFRIAPITVCGSAWVRM